MNRFYTEPILFIRTKDEPNEFRQYLIQVYDLDGVLRAYKDYPELLERITIYCPINTIIGINNIFNLKYYDTIFYNFIVVSKHIYNNILIDKAYEKISLRKIKRGLI